MNPVASRLKAIAVTAAFFALSGLALLGVIWGLSALPFTVPGGLALTAYRPHDTVSILSDLRLPGRAHRRIPCRDSHRPGVFQRLSRQDDRHFR